MLPKEIKRDRYLQELIDRKQNGLIKIVTGLRRVGKSYLLFHLFKNHLLDEGIPQDHIIGIVLDNLKNKDLLDPLTLLNHIESKITDKKPYYILLDEIQLVKNFEGLLNSLLHIENADVYVTGNNSRFLSKDIITEFRGRGDEIHLYPLTFREFMTAYPGTVRDGWKEYYTYGGLPYILTRKTETQKISYLSSLFTQTYLVDVISKNRIENGETLETILDMLSSSVGSLTNPKKISDTFKTEEGTSISPETIKRRLTALEDAFLISSARQYNVKGRHYISTPLKYYFKDLGLRNIRIHFRQMEETHIMENIIYNELRARGFSVDVGVVEINEKNATGSTSRKKYEVDFVANLGSRRYYIQSAFALPAGDKIKQEKRSLCAIDDSFKKIIVTGEDIMLKRDNDGITTMSIYDFLLKENSLDL